MGLQTIGIKTIGLHRPKAGGVFSWAQYWKTQPEVLFFGEISKITDGKLYNQVTGSSDYLTVAGTAGSYTFQCPDTAAYLAADTDYLWYTFGQVQRTVTEAELIGYDFTKTYVKYANASPYTLGTIMILKPTFTINQAFKDKVSKDFSLWMFYFTVQNDNGYSKENRPGAAWAGNVLLDGDTVGWFEPLTTGGAIRDEAGRESVVWDLMYGTSTDPTWGAEQNSGVIIQFGVYKITACQVDFFYAGCVVGDVFVCGVVKTCDANNKVQRASGNHLSSYTLANQPVNQVCDGISQFLRTAPFVWNQPCFVYVQLKQITWVVNMRIMAGTTGSGIMIQDGTTPKIKVNAGASSGQSSDLAVGEWGVVRAYFNGANSKFIVDGHDAITGDFGAGVLSGYVIGGGAATGGANKWTNIKFGKIILRTSADSEADIYSYLSKTLPTS